MARRRGNGEGSITRRKDGLYMARYYVETPKGPKRRTLYGKTREEARDKMARALADRIDGLVFDDENLTVGEYLDSWLKGSVRGCAPVLPFSSLQIVLYATPERSPSSMRVNTLRCLSSLSFTASTSAMPAVYVWRNGSTKM